MLNSEHVTDALRFWERGRILYNLALLSIVLGAVWYGGKDWRLLLGMAPALFVLAVAANALYCLAYPADLLLQASEFRAQWRRLRWILWSIGMLTACVLAGWIVQDIAFSEYPRP